MGDYQGALKIISKLLEGDPIAVSRGYAQHDDSDIINQIAEILSTLPQDHFRVACVPSHLIDPPTGNKQADKERRTKLGAFLRDGGDRADLVGIQHADKLASEGAAAVWRAQEPLQAAIYDATRIKQTMVATIWVKYKGYDRGKEVSEGWQDEALYSLMDNFDDLPDEGDALAHIGDEELLAAGQGDEDDCDP